MVVFCAYSLERLKSKRNDFRFLFNLFAIPDVSDLYIIDNLATNDSKKEIAYLTQGISNVTMIAGSNNYAEFTAWLEGIVYAENNKKEYDSYLLINDTVFSHYSLYYSNLFKFIYSCISFRKNPPQAAGTIISGFEQSAVLDTGYDAYIRTAIFAFNHDAKEIFKSSCLEAFSSWDDKNIDLGSYGLVNSYFKGERSNNIHQYLFEGKWYRSTNFENFDRRLLKLKLTAVICEHYFSAKICNNMGEISEIENNKDFPDILRSVTKKLGIRFTLNSLWCYFIYKLSKKLEHS